MTLPALNELLFSQAGILIFKIPILLLLFLYVLFTFIVINRIRAFNRIVHIGAAHASETLQSIAIIQFFLALSLFFLALVIV